MTDDPVAARHGGSDWLSLALIDARNRTLARIDDDADAARLRLAASAGAYQDRWIVRNAQCQRGEDCDPTLPPLAAAEPAVDAWLAGSAPAPGAAALRGWLGAVLERTLDLLARAGDGDAALHFFRLSLLHEDRLAEAMAEAAPSGAPPARAARDPVWLPPQRMQLGSTAGGLVPENERWAHEVAVPELEIDAQPVDWARYTEFAEDGGYDRRDCWTDAGWAWLQATGRRAPRDVEQLRGGAVALRGGRLQRLPPNQPVLHVTRHEAEAWCRWAGRRLPTEPEWELAATAAATRGYCWGDVFEWVAGSARPWPGHAPVAGSLDPFPPPGAGNGVLRGASWQTRGRWRHPKARRFAPPEHDAMFCGFRSCAL